MQILKSGSRQLKDMVVVVVSSTNDTPSGLSSFDQYEGGAMARARHEETKSEVQDIPERRFQHIVNVIDLDTFTSDVGIS
jgi:hypothetical protein